MSTFRPIIEPLLREHMREVSAPVTPPPSEPEQPASENRACAVCDFAPSDDCPRAECPQHDDNSCGRCGHTPSHCTCLKPAEND